MYLYDDVSLHVTRKSNGPQTSLANETMYSRRQVSTTQQVTRNGNYSGKIVVKIPQKFVSKNSHL